MTTVKVNKAKIRREICDRMVAVFDASGEEYTCAAAVFGAVRHAALNEAKQLLARGINLSKSNYSFAFAGNMKDMFCSDAAKAVYERTYGNK